MDFELTLEQKMLKKSFAEFLSKECPFDTVREIKKSALGYSKKIWNKMAKLGWLGLIHEERFGGSEGEFLDLFILSEEIGKALLPSPLFESAVMSAMLISDTADEKIKKKWLPSLINGKKIATVALFDGKGRISLSAPPVTAQKEENGYTISGTYILVPYANIADVILICADIKGVQPGGPTLFMIDAKSDGVSLEAMDTLTDDKVYTVNLDKVNVAPENIIGDIGNSATYMEMMLDKATVLKCGEMIGGFKRVLDMAVNYASTRKQFNVPIGKFQAVQHYCADMAVNLQGAQLIAYRVATIMTEGTADAKKDIAMAKAFCSDTYLHATQVTHQIHGAVGFSEEFDIGLFYKHAKACELIFGHSQIHRATVADAMGL